ncbi:ATP-binding cassette transporter [Syncephalastrum racemosum]|uniref:ATP-binding cassette transporter n=1 Tax=Syncephalastrum racemosum TaxID=13706 RepID=A0A1X2HW84_SYNRA|nr:ATP-binding cassette transporter [Syncephalastrum racemosum]
MVHLFEAHGVSMRLPEGRWLFRDIDIRLDKGEVLVLQGASGTGKTTLLKCLSELIPYTAGECLLRGKPPAEYGIPRWRSKVMYVPQRPTAHPGTPLDLFRTVRKFSSQKEKKQIGNPVEIGMKWNLSESHFNERWANLSGGEMQRCALAVAIAFHPDVLLLDEPTSALDQDSAEKVEHDLKKYACIWITHDDEQARRVETRRISLKRHPAPNEEGYDEEQEHYANRHEDEDQRINMNNSN